MSTQHVVCLGVNSEENVWIRGCVWGTDSTMFREPHLESRAQQDFSIMKGCGAGYQNKRLGVFVCSVHKKRENGEIK